MERDYQKNSSNDMFDFRKSNEKIEEQVQKIEFSGYKKLAFMSLAVAALLSIGLTLGNIGVAKYKSSLEIDKLQELAQIKQQQQVVEKNLVAQEKAKENNNLEQQKQIDFFTNKIKSLDKAQFTKFIDYLDAHKTLYDERLKTIRKSLFDAQLINRSHAVDPNATSKSLEIALVNYKKDLEEVMIKTTSIYSSVKDNRVKEDKITINDMKTFLKLYDQFENGLVIHNKPIELKIKDILYIKNKANVEYNSSNDMFNLDEKNNIEAEKTIKKFRP